MGDWREGCCFSQRDISGQVRETKLEKFDVRRGQINHSGGLPGGRVRL